MIALGLLQVFVVSAVPALIAILAIAAAPGVFQLSYLRPMQAPLFPIPGRRLARAVSFKRLTIARDWLFVLAYSTPLGAIMHEFFAFAGPDRTATTGLVAGIFLIFMAACDRRFKLMPPNILWTAAALAAALSAGPYGFVSPQDAALGFIIGVLMVGVPSIIYLNSRRRMGMGPADAPLVAGVGALLGLQALGVIIIGTAIVALPYQAYLAWRKPTEDRITIPFGVPFVFVALNILALECRAPGWLAMKLDGFWLTAAIYLS